MTNLPDMNRIKTAVTTLRVEANRHLAKAIFPELSAAIDSLCDVLGEPVTPDDGHVYDLPDEFLIDTRFKYGKSGDFKLWLEARFKLKGVSAEQLDKLYSMAYEDGHAHGLHEVYLCYARLKELFQ